MKGMQKIKRGKQFTGVVVYALEPASHHKTDPVVIGGNMAGNHIVDLIREFGQTKLLRPDIKNRYGTTLFAYRMEKNCQKHNGQP